MYDDFHDLTFYIHDDALRTPELKLAFLDWLITAKRWRSVEIDNRFGSPGFNISFPRFQVRSGTDPTKNELFRPLIEVGLLSEDSILIKPPL